MSQMAPTSFRTVGNVNSINALQIYKATFTHRKDTKIYILNLISYTL